MTYVVTCFFTGNIMRFKNFTKNNRIAFYIACGLFGLSIVLDVLSYVFSAFIIEIVSIVISLLISILFYNSPFDITFVILVIAFFTSNAGFKIYFEKKNASNEDIEKLHAFFDKQNIKWRKSIL